MDKLTTDVFGSSFAYNIFKQKYSMNGQETWADTCKRVVTSVAGQYLPPELLIEVEQAMVTRKFIPGGRYLYSSGRDFHQVNNCFLFRAQDSREGWADAMFKTTSALMTGGGIGFDYSGLRGKGELIRRTGGSSTGPLALMDMVNEAGRSIMQGGQRRSAIWAGLAWNHKDITEFLNLKNWSEELKALKEKDFNFRMPMELTNISVIYDTEFFLAIEDKKHPKHRIAKNVWRANCEQAFKTAEPGMSFNFCKDSESLRNAPVSGQTRVLTNLGYRSVKDIINQPVTLWTGKQWAPECVFKLTRKNSHLVKVGLTNGREIICSPDHPFIVKEYVGAGKRKRSKLIRVDAADLTTDTKIASDLIDSPSYCDYSDSYGLGFVFGDGSIKEGRGEISYHVENKKEAFQLSCSVLGAHVVNQENRAYFKYPVDNKTQLLNRITPSFIAGWFDADGCYTRQLLRLSSNNKDHLHILQEKLDQLGIKSVVREDGHSSYKPENKSYTLGILSGSLVQFKKRIPTVRIKLDDIGDEYLPYRESEIRVLTVEDLDYTEDVYCCDVKVEEHSFMAEGVLVSNCTEVTSEDDSDKCNLGTVWINRCESKEEFARICHIATAFLLCGGLYSEVPTEKIKEVGDKNNRIGLGLGGLHEWLLTRGERYIVTTELHKWLRLYQQESDAASYIWANKLDVAIPKGKRAIAPTGTIGIIAETTTGIEPLFCKAYKRRYLKTVDNSPVWHHEYVVDGAVKRLLAAGVPLDKIQDAYDISFEDRVKFQADVQNYVDMAISSTCNLNQWGSETNNEETLEKYSKILLKYAKRLRGFTCYPDGARGGQPLTRVSLEEAMANEGTVFEERENECLNGVCGI